MAKSKIFYTERTSLAVGTSLYAAGDALGTQVALKVPPDGIVRGIVITDADDEASVDINVYFFESQPTAIAANAAFALADADLELLVGVVAMTASATETDVINGRVKYTQTNLPYRQTDSTLYVQCEVESGTPTYTATTDVKIMLIIEHE